MMIPKAKVEHSVRIHHDHGHDDGEEEENEDREIYDIIITFLQGT